VLLALADSANDDGYCWPSVRYLSKKCNMGERSIQKFLARLIKKRKVVRTPKIGHSNLYKVGVSELTGGGVRIDRGGVSKRTPLTQREPKVTKRASREEIPVMPNPITHPNLYWTDDDLAAWGVSR
jgi:hypothetical protein